MIQSYHKKSNEPSETRLKSHKDYVRAGKRSEAKGNLQSLTWRIDGKSLTKWISQLPNLKSLAIHVKSLPNLESLGKTISGNCPELQNMKLFIYGGGKELDNNLAIFLEELKQNSLRKLFIVHEKFSREKDYFQMGPHFMETQREFTEERYFADKTLLSLNHHAASLRYLKLCYLQTSATEMLHLIRVCKSLVSLQFSLFHNKDLKKTDNDLFQAIVNWICNCRGLRELSVGNSLDGTAILVQVCSKDWIQLKKLEILKLSRAHRKDFYRALSSQTSLEYLRLRGDTSDARSKGYAADTFLGDVNDFTSALNDLKNLKHLDIILDNGSNNIFKVIKLQSYLPKTLEEFIFGCNDNTDDLWPAMAELHNLKALTIKNLSKFSYQQILAFVNALHSTNKGIVIYIEAESHRFPITKDQKSIIQSSLSARVGGNFEIEPYNDMSKSPSPSQSPPSSDVSY
ncbi:hypothetical protein K3495_g5698 [Podosphaera aphanis]|nr:hypothetical protein K3495_g5698 [Podosphaera aphanis]